MIKNEKYTLYNGVEIPKIGLGTWQIKNGEEAYNSVRWALEAGYRNIDTAYIYENEISIGQAIIDSKIPRKEIFITTKLPADIKDYNLTIEYFNKSLNNLQIDYLDLFLIHAPWPWNNVGEDYTHGNIEAWKAMIHLYNLGKVKAIGVSNFHDYDIKHLIEATHFKPMVNQIRYFIGNTQQAITDYCQKNDILIQAYSPLATGELINHPKIINLAEKYNTSASKICLKFCIQNGTSPLPKSTHMNRIKDNLDLNFTITNEDMEMLNSLTHIASTRPFRS